MHDAVQGYSATAVQGKSIATAQGYSATTVQGKSNSVSVTSYKGQKSIASFDLFKVVRDFRSSEDFKLLVFADNRHFDVLRRDLSLKAFLQCQ